MFERTNENEFIIAHATDLSAEGGIAFRHSVALALQKQAPLVTLHVNPASGERPMPEPSDLGWDIGGLSHHKVTHECCDDPVETLLDALHKIEPNLLIVGAHKKTTFERLTRGSTSEAIATNQVCPTLFLPIGEQGLIDDDGQMTFSCVMVAVGDKESGTKAFDALKQLVPAEREINVVLFHSGERGFIEDFANQLEAPEAWQIRTETRDGDFEAELENACSDLDVDLIVMATRRTDGIMDLFRGTHTQRILREHFCPMLATHID